MRTTSRLLDLVFYSLLGLLLPVSLYAEAPSTIRSDELRRLGQASEKRGEWLEATRYYEEVLRRDRAQADCRDAYVRCLRQVHLQRRHRDPSYRSAVTKLSTTQALDLYEQVLALAVTNFVERPRTDLSQMFQQGVQELRFALEQEYFLREHLAGARPEIIEAFKVRLESWSGRSINSRTEAREQVLAIARAGHQLGLATKFAKLVALTALEFAAGAVNNLDEYTLFLTSGHLSDCQASLRGRFVGVGIDVGVVEQHLEITRVYPRSPAAEAGLARHDRILRIDRQAVDNLSPELATEKLRGDAGSILDLEVASAGELMPHAVKLVRRPVVMPSVEHELLDDADGPIGNLRIAAFQENTVQEVKEALAQFQSDGVRAVLIDLRGNSGGAFRAAVQVAELFLGEGVIVHTQSQLKEFNRSFRADIMNPFALPLVVLIDSETASSAEVVAGALKERNRALIVGQPTFGKGSIQYVLPLERLPAGIRITVARFYSPLKNPYSGRGIAPDVPVEEEGEATFARAVQEAKARAAMMMTVR